MDHTLIIGNGISGITAARHIRKLSDRKITVVSDESKYFFSRTAMMYVFMGHMTFEHTKPYEDNFWQKNRIDLVFGRVEKVETDNKEVKLSDGTALEYDELIIATGSVYNVFDWPGADLEGVTGLYHLQDMEKMERATRNIKKAVIVGGGLIGVEMAEMALSRGIETTILAREQEYWDNVLPKPEAKFIGNHIRSHGVDLRLNTQLKQIVNDGMGRVGGVLTDKGERIDCQFVGLTVGVRPNIGFLSGSGIETNRGVLINEHLETSAPGVYAVGDCAEHRTPPPGRNSIEQVWYTGRMMGETVAKSICGSRTTYQPGPWFNSAKFFDLEYQTYGKVAPVQEEGEARFYWEHSDGKKCMHIVFDKNDRRFIGINVVGMRLRHVLFDQWLREGRDIDYVAGKLKEANFDPEFFHRHEEQIIEQFYRDFPKHKAAAG